MVEEDVEKRVREDVGSRSPGEISSDALRCRHGVDEVGLRLERRVVGPEVRELDRRVVYAESRRVARLASERAGLVRRRDEPLVEVPHEVVAFGQVLHRDVPGGLGVLEARPAAEVGIVGRAEDRRILLRDAAAVLEERVEPLEEVVDPYRADQGKAR